jgi:aspartate/methionine/tyrosine aminotransferase
MLDINAMLSDRAKGISSSGIRRIFELGKTLENPINFSIGQPDFPVPEVIKRGAIEAIEQDANGYTLTSGDPKLLQRIASFLQEDVGWDLSSDDLDVMVTSGTSGGIFLAMLAVLNPGDEMIFADPWFLIYPALATLCGAVAVPCDTYPDFRLTAERVEPLITDRTRVLLVNSPGNPSGVVLTEQEMNDLADLCASRGVLLISDEIYDVLTCREHWSRGCRCPSPATRHNDLLLVRGFGKSLGCTGWRLGYAAGPAALIAKMATLQQYTFVCAPSMAQAGVIPAFDIDMAPLAECFHERRDRVVAAFDGVTELTTPSGAFYAFPKIPESLGMSGTAFAEAAIDENVLLIPGARSAIATRM